jgi:hypothetical protein
VHLPLPVAGGDPPGRRLEVYLGPPRLEQLAGALPRQEQDLQREASWPRVGGARRIEQLENGPQLIDIEGALSRRGGDRTECPRPQPMERRGMQHSELHPEVERLAQEPEHVLRLRQVSGRDDLLDDRAPGLPGNARPLQRAEAVWAAQDVLVEAAPSVARVAPVRVEEWSKASHTPVSELSARSIPSSVHG